MAHRDTTREAEDPRARARWRYHVDGVHKVPREGNRPDHFYACTWCRPTFTWTAASDKPSYSDQEWEQFIVSQAVMDANPIAALAGRIG